MDFKSQFMSRLSVSAANLLGDKNSKIIVEAADDMGAEVAPLDDVAAPDTTTEAIPEDESVGSSEAEVPSDSAETEDTDKISKLVEVVVKLKSAMEILAQEVVLLKKNNKELQEITKSLNDRLSKNEIEDTKYNNNYDKLSKTVEELTSTGINTDKSTEISNTAPKTVSESAAAILAGSVNVQREGTLSKYEVKREYSTELGSLIENMKPTSQVSIERSSSETFHAADILG